MSEEMVELLTELLDYFEMESGFWPSIAVYSGGQVVHGTVPDDLYDLLQQLQAKLIEELDDE